MKPSIYLNSLATTACCLCISLVVFAHEHDTLKCHFAPSSVYTYMLYSAGNGGYLSGNNGYGEMEIAQKFGQAPPGDTIGTECSIPDGHQINEVVVYFGAKKVTHPDDSVYINIYSMNPATGGPDTLLGTSFALQLQYVDTSSSHLIYTDFLMQLPVICTDSFFVSVVLPHTAGDTLGIITSSNGQADSTKLCWIKGNSGWSSLLAAHSLNVDAVIFPSVGDIPEGLKEEVLPFARVNAYPNPAHNNTTIEYTLKKSVEKLEFKLIDISGNVIYAISLNDSVAGNHSININTSKLPSGTYLYSFGSANHKFNGRLEIVR